MENKNRTFKDWKEDDIIIELGLSEKETCDLLTNWLNSKALVSDNEILFLEQKRQKAKKYISAWNEQELQIKFIGPIVELVDFDVLDYFFSAFSERKLEANYKNISLKGKVDWMVAIGKGEPRLPFFFIHEYKKQKGYDNDPKGQLLATMLAASVLNQTPPKPTLFNPFPKHDKDMPIYGCYIVGRWWYFVVLHKGKYCESKPYDSVDKVVLLKIVQILKEQKQMIIKRIKEARASK